MTTVSLRDVTKVFGDGVRAVDRLSLSVEDGELLVLLGPSGCGKSTVLRMVAGLEPITFGEVMIGGRRANDLGPHERHIAMVFQGFALYPHLSAGENIGFPLSLRDLAAEDVAAAVRDVAGRLGLAGLLDRRPDRLSGGERQRVAMGRALIRRPHVFLLDEPLSNLDAQLRLHLRAEISTLVRGLGTTTLYVTHDQAEAMSLGDRVAVLDGGVLQQVGTPQEVYDTPANLFVAAFVGSPRMNLLRAVVDARADGGVALSLGSQRLVFAPRLSPGLALLRGYDRQRVTVGLRPEALGVPPDDPADTDRWQPLRGVTRHVEFLGHTTLVHLATGSRRAAVPGRPEPDGEVGDLVARLPPAERPRIGSTVTLSVDLHSVFVFDAHGSRIVPL